MDSVSTAGQLAKLAQGTVLHRWVQITVGLWIAAHVAVLLLAGGQLPFDRPALAGLPFASQVAAPTLLLIETMVLMAVVYGLTYRRDVPDLAARAPEPRQAARETLMVLAYAALAQAGGWLLGPALGYRPFSFHLAGTLYGCTVTPSPGEVATWAIYNFVAFAVLPVLPTMVLIYCILIPRYLRLTGSFTSTVLLGGVTYAAMHLVEGWSSFATAADTALSLIFVLLGYLGPGMFRPSSPCAPAMPGCTPSATTRSPRTWLSTRL